MCSVHFRTQCSQFSVMCFRRLEPSALSAPSISSTLSAPNTTSARYTNIIIRVRQRIKYYQCSQPLAHFVSLPSTPSSTSAISGQRLASNKFHKRYQYLVSTMSLVSLVFLVLQKPIVPLWPLMLLVPLLPLVPVVLLLPLVPLLPLLPLVPGAAPTARQSDRQRSRGASSESSRVGLMLSISSTSSRFFVLGLHSLEVK